MAEQNPTPPADGYYWFQDNGGALEVVQVADGLMMHTGTDQHTRLSSWAARRDNWPRSIDGRLLGRIPEPVAPGTIGPEGVVVHGPKGCEMHDNGDGSVTFRFNPPFTAKVLYAVDIRCDADLRDGGAS